MTPRRLVVDCDPGIDDVVALAVLAGDVAAGRVHVDALVAVAGNVGRDRCAANARLALDRLGLEGVTVHPGADRPVAGVDAVDAEGFHGGDGLAGVAASFGSLAAPALRSDDPGALLAGLVREAAGRGPVNLLTLGPLTDLALALEADRELPDVLSRVVSMGGGFGTTPAVTGSAAPGRTSDAPSPSPWGNVTARSEFNLHADPVAADRVFAAGLALTLVPLDVTRRVLLTERDAAAVASAGGDELLVALLRSGVERQRRQTGLAGMAAHDPLAALVVTAPGVIGTERRPVAVGSVGQARGECTVAADDRPPISVAFRVDSDGAHTGLMERMGAP